MLDDERTTRQRRLAEVGAAGQARIDRARFTVPPDEAGRIEAEYLRRAGVAEVRLGGERTAFAHADAFRFEAARTVAHGAFAALGKLRRALEMERP